VDDSLVDLLKRKFVEIVWVDVVPVVLFTGFRDLTSNALALLSKNFGQKALAISVF
jgi:hypothetical protein